jgi:hypothetical protein
MELVGKIDEIGKPAWIGLLVLTFILFWPFGLALLAFLIWSGRMGCGKHRGPGRWHGMEHRQAWSAPWRRGETSGNRAFDEYRAETLRKLEDEQREFQYFLERLRHAKDKSEFDDFMADRRRRGEGPAPEPAA